MLADRSRYENAVDLPISPTDAFLNGKLCIYKEALECLDTTGLRNILLVLQSTKVEPFGSEVEKAAALVLFLLIEKTGPEASG